MLEPSALRWRDLVKLLRPVHGHDRGGRGDFLQRRREDELARLCASCSSRAISNIRLGRPNAAIEALVERLGSETLVVLDPNVRPQAIRDAPAYRARLGRVIARSHLVKVSEEDVAWLQPGSTAAGDAFGGGMLAWWTSRGLGRAELADHARVVAAARFGATVAARTVAQPGASPPQLPASAGGRALALADLGVR